MKTVHGYTFYHLNEWDMRDKERIEQTFDFTKGIHRGYGEYKPFIPSEKPMKEIYENCKPTILDRKELFSDDGVCMTREVIKNQCSCQFKQTCMGIAELLAKHKLEEAEELFKTIKQGG